MDLTAAGYGGRMSLLTTVARFARSPQGRQLTQKAMRYAQSPEGKRRIDGARQKLAARGTRRPPG